MSLFIILTHLLTQPFPFHPMFSMASSSELDMFQACWGLSSFKVFLGKLQVHMNSLKFCLEEHDHTSLIACLIVEVPIAKELSMESLIKGGISSSLEGIKG
jgi:hypothetical protein